MPDQDDHEHARRDEPEPHTHSREVVIRDGTKFSLDLKTALLLGGLVAGLGASTVRQEMALSSARYELQAEITRVESVGDKRISSIEESLRQIKSTNCAIARTLKVVTSECGGFGP